MPTGLPFSRTLRAVDAEGRPHRVLFAVGALVLPAWVLWAALTELPLYQVSDEARVEIEQRPLSLHAQVEAEVRSVELRVGERVAQGDVLLVFDDRVRRAEASKARQELAALTEARAAILRQLEVEERTVASSQKASASAQRQAETRGREEEALAAHAELQALRQKGLAASGQTSELDFKRMEMEAARQRLSADATRIGVDRLKWESARDEGERRGQVEALRREAFELDALLARVATRVEVLELELERLTVRAPVSGRVGDVLARPGAFLRRGDKLATLVPDGELRVVGYFPPSAVGKLQSGQTAFVRLEAFPWPQFGAVSAQVRGVGTEPLRGRVEVTLRLQETGGLPLAHGQVGAIEVEVDRVSPLALLARTAGLRLRAPTRDAPKAIGVAHAGE